MDASWASWIVGATGLYVALGLLFGVAFVVRGAARIDPGARDAPLSFKLLILPASIALWPLLARRWFGGQTEPPAETNAHRAAAGR